MYGAITLLALCLRYDVMTPKRRHSIRRITSLIRETADSFPWRSSYESYIDRQISNKPIKHDLSSTVTKLNHKYPYRFHEYNKRFACD